MRALVLAALLLLPALASAQPVVDAAEERSGLEIAPPASPTRVGVGLHLQSLDDVDPASEIFPHFSASFSLTVQWRDPRLAFDEPGVMRHVLQGTDAEDRLRTIWHPDLAFENEDGERHVAGRTLAIRADGTVIYEEVLSSRFRARVRLERFPFDRQRFHVAVQSVTWNANKVVLEVLEDKSGFRGGAQRDSLEWRVVATEHRVLRAEVTRSSHPYSRAAFYVIAERAPGFYLWKLLLPLFLIVAFTWSTFWMTGEPASPRLQRCFIALLSVVAYHHVVADHLPRIPYLTFLDAAVYLAFTFNAATVIQVVIVHRLEVARRDARAARIDHVSRWAFPATFVLAIAALVLCYGVG